MGQIYIKARCKLGRPSMLGPFQEKAMHGVRL